MTNGADERRQQAEAIDSRPEGHRAQEHPAGPGPGSAQGKEQQSPAQQQRRGEQGDKGPEILLAAHEQRRHQQAGRPPRHVQQLGPFPQSDQVPQRAQAGRKGRPSRGYGHSAQGPGQLQQQPVHGEVVQQEPLQGDPHATSTTMIVMSSRWPRPLAAAMRAAAIRSRGWPEPFFSSASMSLPSRS